MHLLLEDEAATAALAARLAALQPRPAVVYLRGDLGAGKSTLARAWLRALGVSGTIRSPTYTLVERYPLAAGGEALHLDLYRIGDAAELEFLGIEAEPPALWLIEWPERAASALPPADVQVALAIAGMGRRLRADAGSDTGTAWLSAVASQTCGN